MVRPTAAQKAAWRVAAARAGLSMNAWLCQAADRAATSAAARAPAVCQRCGLPTSDPDDRRDGAGLCWCPDPVAHGRPALLDQTARAQVAKATTDRQAIFGRLARWRATNEDQLDLVCKDCGRRHIGVCEEG